MKPLCLFFILSITSYCLTSEHVLWEKTTHPIPQIASAPGSRTLDMALILLARGYQETGPCIAPLIPHAKRTLIDINIPTVLADIIMRYFCFPARAEQIEKMLQNNWWVLFEKHIGKHLGDKSTSSIDTTELYNTIIKQPRIIKSSQFHIQSVTKEFLDDLQKLADIGYAYNPYAYTYELIASTQENCCNYCSANLFPHYETRSYFESGYPYDDRYFKKESERPYRVALQCSNIECTKKITAILCNKTFTQLPRLLMLMVNKSETVSQYQKPCHTASSFSLVGSVMLHTYTAHEPVPDNDSDLGYISERTTGHTLQELITHVHDDSSDHNIYYGKNGHLEEGIVQSRGGQFYVYAMLYSQKNTPRCTQPIRQPKWPCIISWAQALRNRLLWSLLTFYGID